MGGLRRGLQLAGFALPVEYPFDYVLALSWGILFRYFVIAPMRHRAVGEGLKRAARTDFLALSAFEIGLFGWMVIMQLDLFPSPHLPTGSAAFWSLMQAGMLIGFVTTQRPPPPCRAGSGGQFSRPAGAVRGTVSRPRLRAPRLRVLP